MKIAIATDDGVTISRRLGRASHYLVLTVADNQVVHKEEREKPGHGQVDHSASEQPTPATQPGCDRPTETDHTEMLDAIRDCDAIIVADEICGTCLEMRERGINPFVTELDDAAQAVEAFLRGRLNNYSDWLH